MNICMISQYLPNIGGIENIVSDLSERVAGEGHNVSVVAPCYPGTRPYAGEPERLNGVHIYRFNRTRGLPLGVDELKNMYSMVLKAHERERFDIIHAHFAKNEGLVGSRAARKLGLPLITTVHGSDIMDSWGGMCERPWSRFWVRQALKRSFRLSTVSGFLKDEVQKHGIPEDKVRVIHNWIDPGEFSSPSGRSSKDGSQDGMFHILSARRLVKKNGVDLLLKSLEHMEQSPLKGRYRLHILSNGPEKERLKQMVLGRPYGPQVEFHGPVPFADYLSLLHQADVCCVPSRWEGFGMVVLEAFAAGTPVVAARVGGIPEIIRDGENGLLVSTEASSFAEALIRLHREPGLRRKLSGNAVADVNGHFHYRRGIREWLDHYSSTINDFRKV